MGEQDDDKKEKEPDSPGGVQHDARGNAVWQWAVETGRHAVESTSRLLKRLEVPGLKLEDDPEVLQDKAEAQRPGIPPAGPARIVGYDPYGGANVGKAPTALARSAPAKGLPPATKAAPAAKPLRATKPAAAAKPARSLLQRLFRRD
jgi:hypothetical protein